MTYPVRTLADCHDELAIYEAALHGMAEAYSHNWSLPSWVGREMSGIVSFWVSRGRMFPNPPGNKSWHEWTHDVLSEANGFPSKVECLI